MKKSDKVLFERLEEVVKDLGWNMIGLATMDGKLPGMIIGESVFIDNMYEILKLVDSQLGGVEGLLEDPSKEIEEAPESKLVPKKGEDDDPTYH